jgi:hypothetical protein
MLEFFQVGNQEIKLSMAGLDPATLRPQAAAPGPDISGG